MTTSKTKLSKAERAAYALVGRIGGKATARKLGKTGMSKLGTKGAKKRWANQRAFEKQQGIEALQNNK